jgi:ribosomal protein S18 acetylase RimI-like enzyme
MVISQRAFIGEEDIQAMIDLARMFPSANIHVVDLPFRLSSWALDCSENVGLWYSGDGQLRAWAVLQTPFWALDLVFHPEAETELLQPVLAWADRRARQVLHTPYGRPYWCVPVLPTQRARIRELERAGYARQDDGAADSWSKVLLQRPAQSPLAACAAPSGFILRPLAGFSEIRAFVQLQRAVFESENMTREWRARILRCPEYRPDLDLVGIAPDGQMAAFCICWLDAGGGRRGQVEPMGVRAEYRGLGLGRAILHEGLRRLHKSGAERVLVETDSYRDAAMGLYRAAGFRQLMDVPVFRKDYDGAGG